MFKFKRRRSLGIVFVLLPLIIASMGMMWGNSVMLDGISSSVEKVDQTRNQQAIRSAFNNEVERIASLLSDNAKWDDAVDHAYETFDEAWLLNTWGFSTADGNYDSAFVIDASGKSLIGFQAGKKSFEQPSQLYGNSFSRILLDLPSDAKTFAVSRSAIKSKLGVAAIAVAPILPHTADRQLISKEPRFLIFSRTIDAAALQALGEQYVIKDLAYVDEVSSSTGSNHKLLLTDRWGDAIIEMSWATSNLGQLARQSYFGHSVIAIALLLAAMTPVAIALRRTLLKLERNENDAQTLARRDTLSNLSNRLSFMEGVQSNLNATPHRRCTVMLIDLDGFKNINDIFDHAIGDKLIRAIAAGLACIVDQDCKLARLGGDEFAIAVFGEQAEQRAIAIAENIVMFVAEPFNLDGRFAVVGASIGIAESDSDAFEAQELLRRADIAMYAAKESGGNGHRFYKKTMDFKNSENASIADELRKLLQNADFDINYQPLVNSSSGEIRGVEALARWPQSSSKRFTPDRFIAVAEQFGMIDQLGQLITKKAFHDAALWPKLHIAVNISPLQLSNRHLVAEIVALSQEAGFDLRRLEVEFTEAVLIKNSKRVREVIQELKNLGVSVALDDFGSGYASVGFLRKFNFDTIKLDRSLTRLAASNADAMMIVQGAVLIAKGLKAMVVAEGVETENEAKIMRLAGCSILQGYYFSKPLTAGAITDLVMASPHLPHQLESVKQFSSK